MNNEYDIPQSPKNNQVDVKSFANVASSQTFISLEQQAQSQSVEAKQTIIVSSTVDQIPKNQQLMSQLPGKTFESSFLKKYIRLCFPLFMYFTSDSIKILFSQYINGKQFGDNQNYYYIAQNPFFQIIAKLPCLSLQMAYWFDYSKMLYDSTKAQLDYQQLFYHYFRIHFVLLILQTVVSIIFVYMQWPNINNSIHFAMPQFVVQLFLFPIFNLFTHFFAAKYLCENRIQLFVGQGVFHGCGQACLEYILYAMFYDFNDKFTFNYLKIIAFIFPNIIIAIHNWKLATRDKYFHAVITNMFPIQFKEILRANINCIKQLISKEPYLKYVITISKIMVVYLFLLVEKVSFCILFYQIHKRMQKFLQQALYTLFMQYILIDTCNVFSICGAYYFFCHLLYERSLKQITWSSDCFLHMLQSFLFQVVMNALLFFYNYLVPFDEFTAIVQSEVLLQIKQETDFNIFFVLILLCGLMECLNITVAFRFLMRKHYVPVVVIGISHYVILFFTNSFVTDKNKSIELLVVYLYLYRFVVSLIWLVCDIIFVFWKVHKQNAMQMAIDSNKQPVDFTDEIIQLNDLFQYLDSLDGM